MHIFYTYWFLQVLFVYLILLFFHGFIPCFCFYVFHSSNLFNKFVCYVLSHITAGLKMDIILLCEILLGIISEAWFNVCNVTFYCELYVLIEIVWRENLQPSFDTMY